MAKLGRNDPCPCGSGRKYKACCQGRDARLPGSPIREQSLNELIQLAVQKHQAGKLADAENLYLKVLEAETDQPEAIHLLGVIAYQTCRHEQAIALIRRAIAINPADAMYYSNLGLAYHAVGDMQAALDQYQQGLLRSPCEPMIFNNKGNTLRALGRFDEAIENYQQALKFNQRYPEAYCNLGIALHEQGNFEDAIARYRHAISLKPDYVDALCNLASVLTEMGEMDEAEIFLKKALALQPDKIDVVQALASHQIQAGHFNEAKTILDKILAVEPEAPRAWAMLSRTRKMTTEDVSWLTTAESLLARKQPPVSDSDKISLYFSVGKYFDDTKQYDRAFAAYRAGNELKCKHYGSFDRVTHSQAIDSMTSTYNHKFLEKSHEGANLSSQPVLVVGMPRSGTSLLEQIIASHPQAFGAGELPFWAWQFQAHRHAALSGEFPPGFIAGLATEYSKVLKARSSGEIRVVDKMPSNFLRLGLIHIVFPQAAIIHIKRNPLDTCLSIYFQNFKASHSYGTSLDDLNFYYREYQRIMAHWKNVLPHNKYLEISYEDLTEDQEYWSRRIVEFIGLEWDERCLNFHETERRVQTASNWQVRQKIYHSSKARWRNYEAFLGPLRELREVQ